MLKILILATFLALSLAESEGWDSNGKYKFEYGVKDPHTGDHKSQWEISDAHGVKGGYTVDEADGTKRYVQYKADKWHGFQAIVKRVGHATHPKSYAIPFVVKPKKYVLHKADNDFKYGYGQIEDCPHSVYSHDDKSRNDQLTSSSIQGDNVNGWMIGDKENYASSYVKQKDYY